MWGWMGEGFRKTNSGGSIGLQGAGEKKKEKKSWLKILGKVSVED
jgi:hypothetical protein